MKSFAPTLKMSGGSLALLTLLFGLPFYGCNFEKLKSTSGRQTQSVSESGYDQIRLSILEPSCLGCHSTRAPVLTSYEAVVANLDAIENEVLVEKAMPPRAPLAANLQELLATWIKNGAPREGSVEPVPVPTVSPAPSPIASIPRPFTYGELKSRVLESKCLGCHSTGNADGLTPLDTYADISSVEIYLEPLIFGVGGSITIPVEQRMPPQDSPQLTREEKAYFLLWLNDGSREK